MNTNFRWSETDATQTIQLDCPALLFQARRLSVRRNILPAS